MESAYQAESIDFHSGYRGYEIFVKHCFDGATCFIAYKRNDIQPIRGSTLADVMGHIDVLCSALQQHQEATNATTAAPDR